MENFCLFILKSVALKTFTVNSAIKWIAAKIKKGRKVSERLRPTSNYENRIYEEVWVFETNSVSQQINHLCTRRQLGPEKRPVNH